MNRYRITKYETPDKTYFKPQIRTCIFFWVDFLECTWFRNATNMNMNWKEPQRYLNYIVCTSEKNATNIIEAHKKYAGNCEQKPTITIIEA